MVKHHRFVRLFIVMLCLIVWLGSGGLTLYADWAYFSPEELEERADLIVLGTIERPIREKETARQGYTDWEVTVSAYLKEDGERYETIVVTTPGNRMNKNIYVSTDFSLDEKGANVLLFLERSVSETKQSSILRPITPNAVVPVEGDQLRHFVGSEESRTELEAMLDKRERIPAELGTVSAKYAELVGKYEKENRRQRSAAPIVIIAGVIVTAAVIVMMILLFRRRSKA